MPMQRLGEADSENKSPVQSSSTPLRRKWILTQEAFDKLLAALGPDRERAGETYLEIRRNLVRFFEWRGSPLPEDQADETFNRLAKRVAGGEEILNPMSYCLGVARMLLLESNKERAREQLALSEMAGSQAAQKGADEHAEARMGCLRECLETLSPKNRRLIVQYY